MSRAPVLFACMASLALAACGASARQGGSTGGAGASSDGGSTGAAGSGGVPTCQVNILPVLPASFDGLAPGPSSTLRVRGEVTGDVPSSFDWKWSVALADDSPVPVTWLKGLSLLEFPLASAGTYTISVALTNSTCTGTRTITVVRPGAKTATFRLRVTPSSSELAPAQDFDRQVSGGTPSGRNVIALDAGFLTALAIVRADTGEALPSYVRLTNAATGAVLETRTSAAGPNRLRVPQGLYAMVVVPDGDFAPVTFAPRTPADIDATPVALDGGAVIQGTVSDGAGAPIPGATVVLRTGDLVSTAGTTDAAGAFHVRARNGTFGVTVVSPLTAGGLESKLAVTNGLVIDTTSAPPPLAIKIQPGALVAGTVALTAQDAASLGASTRVTLTATLADVGTIAMGAGAPRSLAGSVHFSLHPAPDGTVTTGGVPRGKYQLTVFPAKADASDAVTTSDVDLQAGSAGPLAVKLAQKVMLTGRLLPAEAAAGAHLFALDAGGLPIEAEGDAGPDGAFALAVSPGRSYRLRALPRVGATLANATFPPFAVSNAAPPVQDRTMPPALLYAGRVVDPSLQGVGAALVQAFCRAADSGCDPAVPVAETVTRSDGTFRLMLPDPDGTP
ncbi:MAG TPA: carboxypeptidase-like regulatory domain-containing protein [Polyangia bacterium]|jgi:hypothetical protein|nr:carboxypeptidase-like regulatory domain-containing protein [Polyangia bacterium]